LTPPPSVYLPIYSKVWEEILYQEKKGGLKAHAVLPLNNMVPELIWLTTASTNDKDFLGQLKPLKGSIYVFDKGYVNYSIYKKMDRPRSILRHTAQRKCEI